MSDANDKFAKDLQDIFSKALEINTHYMREGARLASQLGSKRHSEKKIDFLRPEVLTQAFTAFTKLNLEYYKNVLDLGLSLTNQVMTGSGNDEKENGQAVNDPAFTLSGDSVPGISVTLRFILDNVKEEEVFCQLENTSFVSEEDGSENHEIIPEFIPQSFALSPGGSKAIAITIKTGEKVQPGRYTSKVKVVGFEPSFFVIALTVSENANKTKHASRRKKPEGKEESK